MSDQSAQEKAAQEQYGELKGFAGDIKSGRYNAENKFDNYSDPFGYDDINSQLEDIFSGYESKIKKDTNDTIATQQGGAAARMASRGIVGGSAVDDTMTGIASDINKTKVNALGELGIGKASSMAELMKYINQLNLSKTNLSTNVDLSNKRNALGGLSNAYGLQQNAIGGLDDTTGWDDVFSVVKTGAGSAGGIAKLVKALSDRRFKENVVRVGKRNGINIYEFSYIGSPRRFSGVMADEVDAVINIGGIYFVDYSKLPGIEFMEVSNGRTC